MTTKHIPGPWQVGIQDYGEEFDWCILTEKADLVADVFGPRSAFNDVTKEIVVIGRSADDIEATARLIAAAPELLASLKEILGLLMECGADEECAEVCAARAAIAKATGADK